MKLIFDDLMLPSSPVHQDPPDYSSGRGTSWGFGIYIDGTRIINNDLPPQVPVHWRSRDRHDPGDGDYTNRWAFPPEGERDAHLPSYEPNFNWVMAADNVFNWKYDYNIRSDYLQCQEHWDGSTYVFSYVYDYNGWGTYFIPYCDAFWIGINSVSPYSSDWWSVRYSIKYYYYHGSWFKSKDDAEEELSRMHSILSSCTFDNPYAGYSQTYRSTRAHVAEDLRVDAAEARLSLEMDLFPDKLTMLPHNHIGTLEAEAYRRAVDSLPKAGMNNIANIVEVISLINRMLFSGGLTTVGTVSDAWLAYRYSYSTTKSDIKELVNLMNRLENLTKTSLVTTRGVVYDDDFTVRCSIELGSNELAKIHNNAERWGLALTAYNAWDLVPYSFIVDWFLDVGGALERGESIKYAYRCGKPAWFSVERRWVNEFGCREIYYYRHHAIPNLSEAYLYRVVNDPSGVTIVKRAVDALALVR